MIDYIRLESPSLSIRTIPRGGFITDKFRGFRHASVSKHSKELVCQTCLTVSEKRNCRQHPKTQILGAYKYMCPNCLNGLSD